MEFENLIYEKPENAIVVIKFNRPKSLNALNAALHKEFKAALGMATQDREGRVVLLKGEGRAFCAGTDIKEHREYPTLEEYRQVCLDTQNLFRVIAGLEKPLIAVIHGYCVGAGLEIAMIADIRIAAENAIFSFAEAAVGAVITTAGSQLMAKVVGLGRAKELVCTAKRIDGKEAERIGLVNRVVPLEELDKAANALAHEIINCQPIPVGFMRTGMDHAYEMSSEAYLNLEVLQAVANYSYGERQKAMEAWAKAREKK